MDRAACGNGVAPVAVRDTIDCADQKTLHEFSAEESTFSHDNVESRSWIHQYHSVPSPPVRLMHVLG
eukprot:m.150947 g.150947  ORF g.150947 m.150947 type:complete len:67 (+) comp17840_c0_seq8:37-237(+)